VPFAHAIALLKVKKLGQGGFGTVFLVRDNRDGKDYVMKEVDLSKLDAKGKADALKEAAFLEKMSHPNIIGYNEYFEGSSAPRGRLGKVTPMLYIIMGFADGGDLEGKIKEAKVIITRA
jgi:NIMA (never in mitosis gene a)-related kinase